MVERMSEERLAEIREEIDQGHHKGVADLLIEIDALRAELVAAIAEKDRIKLAREPVIGDVVYEGERLVERLAKVEADLAAANAAKAEAERDAKHNGQACNDAMRELSESERRLATALEALVLGADFFRSNIFTGDRRTEKEATIAGNAIEAALASLQPETKPE